MWDHPARALRKVVGSLGVPVTAYSAQKGLQRARREAQTMWDGREGKATEDRGAQHTHSGFRERPNLHPDK